MYRQSMDRRTERAAGPLPGRGRENVQQEDIDTMQTSRIRLAGISAATLALVVAGTAAVAAHPGDGEDRFGLGQGPMGQFGLRGEWRGQLRGMLAGTFDGFVRSETTYETDDGLVTRRVDNGTVSTVSDAGIEYAIASGETATAATDEDTQVIALSVETVEVGLRGFSRERLLPEAIDMADIAAGSEVAVWATSQADGTFLAERIVVQPDLEVSEDGATSEDSDAAAADDATDTEAEASPASDA